MIPLLKRELMGLWRTGRVIIFVAVMLFFAISGPAVTKYLPDIVGGQLQEGVTITFPEPTALEGYRTFLKNVAQVGFLVVVLATMGSVAGERSQGITATFLAMPVRHRDYLLSKLATQGALVAAAIFTAGLVAWAYVHLLLGPLALSRVLAATSFYAVWGLAIVSLTLFFSSLFRSQLVAGVASLLFIFLAPLLELLSGKAGAYLPIAILTQGDSLLAGAGAEAETWFVFAGGLSLVVLSAFGAVAVLRRAELAR